MTQEKVTGEHELHESIQIDIFYPDHVQRTESKLFAKTKHHLIHELDTPCWICGSKEKREVHHFHLEWADANGVDIDKLKLAHPNFDWTTFNEITDFVDSEYNMMVLCEKHHRARDHGIHLLPYPIWIMQKYQKSDFVFSPDEEK